MDSWSNPAFRPSEGTTMTTARRKDTKPVDPELLTRTSWVNAEVAYRQVKKGKANGNECALWLRWHLQKYMYTAGCFIQVHCGKVLFVGLLLLSLCCVGLKTATIETDVQELWVEEGGRLEEELKYTKDTIGEGSGTTNEILIQTPKMGSNILTVDSLQLHLQALLRATQISVDLYDVTWKFRDLCYLAEFPSYESTFIDQLIDHILPCVIVTPLDCFWDGAKVLGPDNPLNIPALAFYAGGLKLKWTNLNPMQLVETLSSSLDMDGIIDVMKRAGIGSGYLEKPCLNPMDEECPDTAPNKDSLQPPDIGAELTGGCEGFATKFMHWEEDLIVGGVVKNRTGYINRAEALQSIVQIMGEKELYTYYQETYKTHNMEWSQDKARAVLEAWQRKFTEEMNSFGNDSNVDNLYGFSTTSLLDIMKEFSDVSTVRVVLGYILMVVYACVSLLRWNNAVQSQSGIGIAGVLLVALSVAAGLGISSVLGISFNASTTQIIPFLALGLGVDDMFLIAHTYAENSQNNNIPCNEQTGECLKRTGTTVLLTSVSNMLAFFSAAIIPIPALRAFSLQAGLLILFNLASVLLVFPAICSLDMVRREDKRVDVLCCFHSYSTNNMVIELQPRITQESETSFNAPEPSPREPSPPPSYSPPPNYSPPPYKRVMHHTVTRTGPDGTQPVTSLAPGDGAFIQTNPSLATGCPSTTSSRQCLTPDESVTCQERCVQAQRECLSTSLTRLATKYYGPFLQKSPVKVFTVLFFLLFLILGIWGTVQVKDGIDLTDLVPKDTEEYSFLEAQSKYFGFYNIYLVTKDDFDYPHKQEELYEYHSAFQRVDRIIKREDGSMPSFWLGLFRQWLRDLQRAFDQDLADGKIYQNGWYHNASDEGIFAYKLLVQTGDVDNPVDKDQVLHARLVDDNGIINTAAFYNYLSAWVSNDALAYAASMASFYPEPHEWFHEPLDVEMKIPKSQPLEYTQLPFYLTNLSSTDDILETVKTIRTICDTYTDKGVPNYPSGIPFTFWEQYINLRYYLMLALLCVLGVTFLFLTIVLMNPWMATVVVVVLTMILVELFGFMGISGIKLSAIPAVILIVAVGIGVEFTVHVCVGFLTAIGSRNRRMVMSLEHTFAPVVHGAISTLLGIIMLVGAEFEFIIKYFFNVLTALVVIGLLNGLLLLPVLLSFLGPWGEIRPKDNSDRIETPTPEPSPKPKDRPVRTTRNSRRLYPRMPSDISLTTISEEPTQYSSHEIIVEPEVVVETTTIPMEGGGSQHNSNQSSRNSSPPASAVSTPPATHVTRVKATATVKVEVHTPLPGSVNQEHIYKSKRRKLREIESSDSDSSQSSKS